MSDKELEEKLREMLVEIEIMEGAIFMIWLFLIVIISKMFALTEKIDWLSFIVFGLVLIMYVFIMNENRKLLKRKV